MAAQRGFRALLVGVAHYADHYIPDLPCVTGDISSVGAALRSVDYQVVEVPPEETGLAKLRAAVQFFLRNQAHSGDTLLVYLDGHGVHTGGGDYLIPADAVLAYEPFSGHCVPIDLNSDIERSRAGDVLVFIDACREGFDEILCPETKGIGAARWSEGTIRRVANRKVAYVFACSRGEYARFGKDDDPAVAGTFSVFSRAFAELVADEFGPSTLADFEIELQARVDEIGGKHGIAPQRIRVLTESDKATFTVVARGGRKRAQLADDLAALRGARAAALDAYRHIAPRIAGVRQVPAVDVADLLDELAELDRLATAGGWRGAGARPAALATRIDQAAALLRDWHDTALRALESRNQMRAELDAYRQAAAHHGVVEDPVLHGLLQQAEHNLYRGGCDLVVARGVLEELRMALFNRGDA